MAKKLTTIDLKGKGYATVPTRIKEFREDCPNGLIEPKPTFLDDGNVMFSVRILKDKSDQNSAESTGHAIGKVTVDKSFEKLETIATGRALALLGYMASGEVASSEEMEEFEAHKREKKDKLIKETITAMKKAKTLTELKKIVTGSVVGAESEVQALKDELKLTLK